MDKSNSYCGIECNSCDYKIKNNCPGCKAMQGKMFWGSCRIAQCCLNKNISDCSECSQFPCDLLKEYSYDKEHGDAGKRIENLKKFATRITK